MPGAHIDMLCRLARLRLAGEERAVLERDLEAILAMTELIRDRTQAPAPDTPGAAGGPAGGPEAATPAALPVDALRKDASRPGWPVDAVLGQAPRRKGGFFVAPPVFGERADPGAPA